MPKGFPTSGPVSGLCENCTAPFIGRSIKRFCAPCLRAREQKQQREHKAELVRLSGGQNVGALHPCCDCRAPFKKTASAMRRCLPCRETYMARWQQNRRQTCAKAAMTDRVRRGINGTLGKGLKGRRSWEALVGWTKADLMAHLERQFVAGMTWANRDRWDIDHVVPLKSFSYTTAECPDFRAAWALSNLRPLWKPENATKQGRRTLLI